MVIFLLLIIIIGGVALWRQRLLQGRRQQTLRQLRRWIGEQTTLDPTLQRWMNGLSASESEVLVDLLDGYCTSLNWELSWLFTPHIQKTPMLKQALEEGISAYACSILASLQLVDDVYVYKTYIALSHKPQARQQYTIIQKLFKRLAERGVLLAAEKHHSWWRRQPPQRQQIAAVTRVFDQDPGLAMAILKALLIDEAEATVQQIVRPLPIAA